MRKSIKVTFPTFHQQIIGNTAKIQDLHFYSNLFFFLFTHYGLKNKLCSHSICLQQAFLSVCPCIIILLICLIKHSWEGLSIPNSGNNGAQEIHTDFHISLLHAMHSQKSKHFLLMAPSHFVSIYIPPPSTVHLFIEFCLFTMCSIKISTMQI